MPIPADQVRTGFCPSKPSGHWKPFTYWPDLYELKSQGLYNVLSVVMDPNIKSEQVYELNEGTAEGQEETYILVLFFYTFVFEQKETYSRVQINVLFGYFLAIPSSDSPKF